MVRLANRLVVLAGFVVSLGLTLPACTEDVQSMLFVRQVQGLIAPQCTVDNSPDASRDLVGHARYRVPQGIHGEPAGR